MEKNGRISSFTKKPITIVGVNYVELWSIERLVWNFDRELIFFKVTIFEVLTMDGTNK